MAKELLNIKIQTLPNGYALDVNKEQYMYHSIEGLIEGFMLHVGLEETAYCEKKFIKDFLATAVAWKTGDIDIVKKYLDLAEKNERLSSVVQNNRATIKNLKERVKNFKNGENVDDNDDADD